MIYNKNENNLAQGRIRVVFARWQQQFAIACFDKSPFALGSDPHLTECVMNPTGPQVYLPNGI